jgi:3-hydroxyisobutyryl-CoA hydrolase
VSNVLDEFSADPFSETEVAKGPQILAQSALLGSRRVALDHVFGQKSAEGIFAALEQLAAGAADSEAAAELRTRGAELDEGVLSWARTTLDALLTKSPRSIKVSLRAIAAARQLEDAEAFRLDMRLATAFCDLGAGRDFHTGVMHTLARDPETGKRRTGVAPWDVSSVADVSDQHISDLFFGDQQAARSAGMTMDVPRLAGLPPPNALSADEQRAQRNKTKG